MADVPWPLQEVSRVCGDPWPMCLDRRFPGADRWPICLDPFRKFSVCVVTDGRSWSKFPVFLVTDGRCVLAEVSRVLGDRWPMCLCCLKGPLQEVSRVLGDQWPMCLGRSFPCAWLPMADVH